jgi:dTMP kinase
MFFLDLKPEEALLRMLKRDEEEMFENLDDLIKVRRKALKLAQGWHIINSKGNIEDVQTNFNNILMNWTKKIVDYL